MHRRLGLRMLKEGPVELPPLRLDHLVTMSGSTGMFQHAVWAMPNLNEGYCTDDITRALTLTVLLEELGLKSPELPRLARTYASFIQYAFNPELKRFRNFSSFDCRWLEEAGSEDSQGHALWALGACVGRSQRPDLQFWSARLFEQALPPLLEARHPRTWAFTLLGICEYSRRFNGNRLAAQARDTLTKRLLRLFDQCVSDDWP